MEDGGFTCPHCGTALHAVPGETRLDLACEQCGGLSVIPAADGTVETLDDAAPPPAREDELSSVRIRQLAAARRAAYRARSYCVIGALVCVVAVVQLAWTGVAIGRRVGWGARPVSYLLFAILAACGAVYFFRKAMELDREAKQSALPEATDEPDFTPLGDGSQRLKDLKDIQ